MNIGDKVWFTAPYNVNKQDHSLTPGQVVPAVVVETGIEGDEWLTIEYNEGLDLATGQIIYQSEISAHINELTIRKS